MRRALFILLVCAPLVLANDKTEPTDPNAPKAREVTLEGRPPRVQGQFEKPTKITTEAELAKAISDKEARAKVLKKVDLKKEYLLLFAWAGSGGDRLSFAASKDGRQVTFTRTQGLTDDLRLHVKLYAIPKGAKYIVAK